MKLIQSKANLWTVEKILNERMCINAVAFMDILADNITKKFLFSRSSCCATVYIKESVHAFSMASNNTQPCNQILILINTLLHEILATR